jgi:hypothetical protein
VLYTLKIEGQHVFHGDLSARQGVEQFSEVPDEQADPVGLEPLLSKGVFHIELPADPVDCRPDLRNLDPVVSSDGRQDVSLDQMGDSFSRFKSPASLARREAWVGVTAS